MSSHHTADFATPPVTDGPSVVSQSSRGAVDAGKELVFAVHLDNRVNSVNAIASITRWNSFALMW